VGDAAGELLTGIGVDAHVGGHAGVHLAQVLLDDVRDQPNGGDVHDREERRVGRDPRPRIQQAPTDEPGNR